MLRNDIEQIARTVLRDYGSSFRLGAVSDESQGKRTVGFSDAVSGATVHVGVWCDEKVSAHHVRQSLVRGLSLND